MKRTITLLLLALTLSTAASAQENQDRKPGQLPDRKEMATKHAERMAQQLKLDDQTKEWFLPIYVEYQDTLQSVNRPQQPAEKKKKKEKETLSDEEALAKVESTFAAEETRVALRRAYYARFKEKLTAQQLMTIFCEQNRMPFRPMGNRGNSRGQRPDFGGDAPGGFGGNGGFGGEF